MQEDTLTNILNMLQNSPGNDTPTNAGNTGNNDLQNLLIKLLLSGGLNNLFTPKNNSSDNEPERPRTINLENYQRID